MVSIDQKGPQMLQQTFQISKEDFCANIKSGLEQGLQKIKITNTNFFNQILNSVTTDEAKKFIALIKVRAESIQKN